MEVRVEGLRHERGGRLVLEVPELAFAPGKVTAVLGPNGAGKSTLLRCIGGLERPAQGRVLHGGRDAQDVETRRRIAFAFQEPVFLDASVRENLELGLRFREAPAADRVRRVQEAAHACGIGHLLERRANRLSAGEAQRANLARALALRGVVTLLDEPLAGLDRASRDPLLYALPELLTAHSTTTVLVTHDRAEALQLADCLVVLIEGRVRAVGAKREVYAAPPDAATAALLGYDVLEADGRAVAVRPLSLRLGDAGRHRIRLTAERVVDAGSELRLVCRQGNSRVEVPLAADAAAPRPGEEVVAATDDLIDLPETNR